MSTSNVGSEYLQKRITAEFALARHIGIVVDSAGDAGVTIRAPLAHNANYKGTAFGGSMYSVAVLAGWAWVTRYLAAEHVGADTVIQDSSMRFLVPVRGELHAHAAAPAPARIDKFRKMLLRAGRGRISVRVELHTNDELAALFVGEFAAAIRE